MTNEEKKKLYAALSAPFPEEAIQRTDGRVTGKGYSTSGIGYQFIVNRLNEVIGVGGHRAHRTVTVKEVTTVKGRPAFEAICDLTLELGEWIDGKFVCWAESLADGGHTSTSEADARKGAYTNALKKAAAMFGVGRQAYQGNLDDDCVPGVDQHQEERRPAPRAQQQVSRVQQQPQQVQAQQHEQHRAAPLPTSVSPLQQQAQAQPSRSRLTSKQLAALWSIARRQGLGQAEFRGQVKSQFSVQPEFLTREQASQLIGSMGNGHAPEATDAAAMPGAEG